MENQHQKITGYRDLSQDEIDLMNEVKAHGQKLGELIATMRNNPDLDQRWVALAQTDLQKGIMFAVRAIARPTTF